MLYGLVARIRASRALLFGACLLALGLGAAMTLESLWHSIRREDLPGIHPLRAVYKVELKGANNREFLNREDAVSLIESAVPGADVVTVRWVEADAEYLGRSVGTASVAVVPDDALKLLGIGLSRGHIPDSRGNAPSRQAVMSHSFANRFSTIGSNGLGELRLKSRGAVSSDAVGFRIVGVTEKEFRSLVFGQGIDLWVGEREWPNWLLSSDVPERILDVLHPVQMVLVFPQESMSAESLASRLIRASEASGHPATVDVVQGSARDPSTTPRAQAQTLIYSTLALATLAICAVGMLFLWALMLVRGKRELEIRAMLGEPIHQSRNRLVVRSVVSVAIGYLFAAILALVALRILANLEPYRNFALGAWLLPIDEFLLVAMRALWAPLCLLSIQLLLAELTLRSIRRSRLSAIASASAPISALIVLSASTSIVAATIASVAFLSQHRLETRDLGFDVANLVQVEVIRSDEQTINAAFDSRPAETVIEQVRERLNYLDGIAAVSTSSVHPLQKITAIEYAMNDDSPDQRYFGNVVRIDKNFFSALGATSAIAALGPDLVPTGNQVFIDRAFEQVHAVDGKNIHAFRLFDMGIAQNPSVIVDQVVPSLFHDGATGDAVPSIFRPLTRSGDIRWIWVRTDGTQHDDDIERIVAQSLKDFGLPFERIEAHAFSDAMHERLLPRVTERNTALIASFVLLALSALASFTLFSFAGRARSKEFALRLAIGATPMWAMIGLLRSSLWTPLVGLGLGFTVAASAIVPALDLLGLDPVDLILTMLVASFATVAMLFVGLVSTARTVAAVSLRETLAQT